MDFVKGQLVRSLAGRDKTRTFAVMAVEGQMLSLADDTQLSEAIRAYDADHPM